MAKGVWCHGLCQVELPADLATDPFNRRTADGLVGGAAGEEPRLGPAVTPVGSQSFQERGKQRRITVCASLSLAHANHVSATIDVGGRKLGDLADPQTGRIHGHEHGAMFDIPDRLQESVHLAGALNDR
jgi:hypothetical protein